MLVKNVNRSGRFSRRRSVREVGKCPGDLECTERFKVGAKEAR
jgi:hypothetical protein